MPKAAAEAEQRQPNGHGAGLGGGIAIGGLAGEEAAEDERKA